MKRHFLTRFLTIGLLLTGWTFAFAQSDKTILVVSVTKGFRHSSIPTAENVIRALAEQSGLFSVDYVRDDKDMEQKMTPEALKKYDAVFFANTTGDLPIPDPQAFLDWIKSGRGFIGAHSATDTFPKFPPYTEMIGGHFAGHEAQVEIDVYVQDREHPACAHWGNHFRIYDEIYLFKDFTRSKVHGLLTQDKHPNRGHPGDFPVAWSKEYGKGKVFYTSLGHREDVWTSKNYQLHLLGGIKWVLGLEKGNAEPQSTEAKLTKEEARDGFRPLFTGVDLKGWKLRDPQGTASWTVQNGMLVNSVPSGGHGTDLVSEATFRDFTVRYEFMVPARSNSGFYLRGRHEIQILDDAALGKLQPGGNGAIYNQQPPAIFASRKTGQWQEAEVTIRGNKITAYLNGAKIHDNVTVNAATGGELDTQLDQPGPIMLQGDHGSIAFRNIRIKPLK